eukprot:364100-Chlamydomonas_euryale.AAC.82
MARGQVAQVCPAAAQARLVEAQKVGLCGRQQRGVKERELCKGRKLGDRSRQARQALRKQHRALPHNAKLRTRARFQASGNRRDGRAAMMERRDQKACRAFMPPGQMGGCCKTR